MLRALAFVAMGMSYYFDYPRIAGPIPIRLLCGRAAETFLKVHAGRLPG